jgi:hypothetical protein
MRHGKDTIQQATDLIHSMRRVNIHEFHTEVFGLSDREAVCDMVRLAKAYHRIQEHDCNGTKTKRMETMERNLECRIEEIAVKYGLRVVFEGDPRGYVVKLFSPLKNVYNTWGGVESGYGIG